MKLEEQLLREYKAMLERWEKGDLYYHTKAYLKQYTVFPFRSALKKYICAALACSRVGLPVTSSIVSWLTGKGIQAVYIELEHLSSLKILEPIKTEDKWRKYQVNKEYIRTVYKKLNES